MSRPFTRRAGLASLLGISAAHALLAPRSTQSATRPDVVLFVTDDMRESDWEMLEQTKTRIGGTWLPNFRYATPQCGPSRATLLTGQYAHNTGVRANKDGWSAFSRRPGGTLFTVLHDAGYTTAVVGKLMNGYRDGPISGIDQPLAQPNQPPYRIAGQYSTHLFADQAVAVITEHLAASPATPLFLNIGFNAPHDPAIPAPEDREAAVGGAVSQKDRRRRRTLLAVDDAVAAIAEAMGPARWNDAVVAFISDHGFLLPEDGHGNQSGKGSWYNEITRVPALIRAPGLAAGTDNRLAATIDLTPTLLRAIGINPVTDPSVNWTIDGRALQDAWERTGILADGRSDKSDGFSNLYFDAVLGGVPTADFAFVRLRAQSRRERPKSDRRRKRKPTKFSLVADAAQKNNRWPRLSRAKRRAWLSYLASFAGCRGDQCREADQALLPPLR